MTNFISQLFFTLVLLYIFQPNIFRGYGHKQAMSDTLKILGKSIFGGSKTLGMFLIPTFLGFLVINLIGNAPFTLVPTMLYSVTVTFSLVLWLSLISCSLMNTYYETISHLMPFGTPTGLMLLLPLIEILSQALRPFTLAIRLSTNLAAGHILVYIFSYFTLGASNFGVMGLGSVVLGLQLLELAISLLQAYIFSALLLMYTQETEENLY